jgi:FtsP/CotA-like multicopper oxidase with cupredoxin domain
VHALKANSLIYLTSNQHGVRQFNSNGEDGVNGITGCAIAPGDSKTYNFQATQYGSSW